MLCPPCVGRASTVHRSASRSAVHAWRVDARPPRTSVVRALEPSTCRGCCAGSVGCADLSQRELAAGSRTSRSRPSAAAESGTSGTRRPACWPRAAALAGLRLALLDDAGARGRRRCPRTPSGTWANRRFPAHLDTRYSDERLVARSAPVRPASSPGTRSTATATDAGPLPPAGRHPGRPPAPPAPATPAAERAAARRRACRRAAPRSGSGGSWPASSADVDVGFTCTCPPGVRRARRPARPPGARRGLPVFLRPGLSRCYRGPVRGSLLLTRRGEALS